MGASSAALHAARAELERIARDKDRLIQAIKDRVPGSEVKEDFARIAARRDELQAMLDGTTEEPVLLHPNMAEHYRAQVARLAEILSAEENRAEAAELIRSLVDRIELTPNADGKLDIDLFGDLAGILSLASKNEGPLDESDPSVQQVKMVAGVGFEPTTFRL